MQTTVNRRNSSIELLRILALLLSFWLHASGSYENNELSAWISVLVSTVGNTGVSCFILISGYYGIRFDVKKMLKLDWMLVFYAWTGLALSLLWGEPVGMEEAVSHVFPVIGRHSWYFTCYFALAFLSPFLNELAETLEKKRFRELLAVMLLLFSAVTTFFFFDITQDGGKGIVHMVLLYLIGRYLRLYHEHTVFSGKRLLGGFFALLIVNTALNGVLYAVTGTMHNAFARDNTLFTIGESVCLFLFFRGRYFESRWVNRVASTVPASFVMEWTVRSVILKYLFDYLALRESDWYELAMLGVSALLIAMGFVIETLRRLVFGRAEHALALAVERQLTRVREGLEKRFG